MESIFVSYSWKNGIIADTLDSLFRNKGIELRRDIRDLNITDSVKAFMKTIRHSDYSIMIISEDYLKSTKIGRASCRERV